MAGNISISAGAAPAQSRTSVSGGFSLPARPAPAPVPAGYQLVYRMGGPHYQYGLTPDFGARYSDGGIVPGQIYGNMRGSREGADMFGFFPTMFQSQPYATASQMYTPSLGVMPLIGYPSKYPHVVMGGYTDYGAPIANQAISMMLPLLMMGLYRQMFPMMPQAPAAAAKGAGGGGKGGSGGGSAQKQNPSSPVDPKMAPRPVENENDFTEYSAVDGYIVGKNPGNSHVVSDATDDMKKVYDPASRVSVPGTASTKSSVLPQGVRDEIRSNWPRVERGLQAATLVPGAMKTSANALFGPSRPTHEALLRAREHARSNPVVIPENVKRAFGAK